MSNYYSISKLVHIRPFQEKSDLWGHNKWAELGIYHCHPLTLNGDYTKASYMSSLEINVHNNPSMMDLVCSLDWVSVMFSHWVVILTVDGTTRSAIVFLLFKTMSIFEGFNYYDHWACVVCTVSFVYHISLINVVELPPFPVLSSKSSSCMNLNIQT